MRQVKYKHKLKYLTAAMLCMSLIGCSDSSINNQQQSSQVQKRSPNAADAKEFIEQAQIELSKLSQPAVQAAWAYQTYINQDTAAVSAYLSEQWTSKASVSYTHLTLPTKRIV